MNIYTHNDGKQKHMSFESWVDCPMMRGYGRDETESLNELREMIIKHRNEMDKLLSDMESTEFSTVKCGCFGNPLAK